MTALTIVGSRTLPSVLREGAERYGTRELLVYDPLDGPPESYSWTEVAARTAALARQLAGLGVGRGDSVHLHLANCPEFLFAWFGAAELGAKIVPTNTASASPEIAFILGHADVGVSITDASGLDTVQAARSQAGVRGELLTREADLDVGVDEALGDLPDVASGDDLAVIYTSGTTSRPKGVRVTHANYLYAGETVAAGLGLSPSDRFLTVLPLFHANAQYYSTMGTMVSGGTIVLTRRFSASGWCDQAIRHRASVASLFAAPMRMILAQERHEHWRAHELRVVAYAQNLSAAEVARWNDVIGAPLLQLYGMTETIGPPVMNPLYGTRRHDAIGCPVLGYSCRIVRDDGSPVESVGEPGELLVAGTPGVSLMAGYLNDDDATRAAIDQGWLRTGDLVRQDADGLLSFVGRTRDMIKRAGENVAAGEVEAVLLDHPGVRDAAVVGVPDAIRDEQIVAFVVPVEATGLDADQLKAWCAERLASFRVPSEILLQQDLPRTAVGKIQKHRLKAAWLARPEDAPGVSV